MTRGAAWQRNAQVRLTGTLSTSPTIASFGFSTTRASFIEEDGRAFLSLMWPRHGQSSGAQLPWRSVLALRTTELSRVGKARWWPWPLPWTGSDAPGAVLRWEGVAAVVVEAPLRGMHRVRSNCRRQGADPT